MSIKYAKEQRVSYFESVRANIVALICRNTFFTMVMGAELDGSHSEAEKKKILKVGKRGKSSLLFPVQNETFKILIFRFLNNRGDVELLH